MYLEWWGQIGYFVVWVWQRINHHRGSGRRRLTFWEIMDDRKLETDFVELIELVFSGAKILRGIKDPGRQAMRIRENKVWELLNRFTAIDYGHADEEIKRQDTHRELPYDALMYPIPQFKDRSEQAQMGAWKHLLMKWCAQAMHLPTTDRAYFAPTDDEKDDDKDIRADTDNLGLNASAFRDVVPGRGPPNRPSLLAQAADQATQAAAAPALGSQVIDGSRPSSSTKFADAIDVSLAKMDGSVLLSYQRGLVALHNYSSAESSVDRIETRMLLNSTLMDKVFFAWFVSLLYFSSRENAMQSRLSGVVHDKTSKEWHDLQDYFRQWMNRTPLV